MATPVDQAWLDELFDWLRIPSVSARSEHNADTARCADWLAKQIRSAGMQADVYTTPGHPIVVGEWRLAGIASAVPANPDL